MSERAPLSRQSIAELRARADALSSEAALRRFAAALRNDRRRGVQALADALERRHRRDRAEARRVRALFGRRRRLLAAGARRIAGVDEVGVGPLAGPVVAAAVVLPERVVLPGLNDSKQLSAAVRERLDAQIREQAQALCVAEVSVAEIERLNVYHAALEAMRRAVLGLGVELDHVLVDARTIPGIQTAQTSLVGGDASDGSIAAASIVAKVYRDALMRRLADRHPGYGFERHMGYGTRQHLEALDRLGASPVHRRGYAPVAAARSARGVG